MNTSQINPFTPDWLRSFSGCEHYTNEQATSTIESLRIYASLLVNPYHFGTDNAASKTSPAPHNTTIAIATPATTIHLSSIKRAA